MIDILGSLDDKIENNEKIITNIEVLCREEYRKLTQSSLDLIPLGKIINIFDGQRIPLSSREREDKKGRYPYYGATGVLDFVDDFIFSGEYVLIAEDGTVIDTKGYPIVQLVMGDFWVNNHAHILQAKNGYTNYSLYIALKCTNVSKAVTGAVQLKINQANLCKIELPSIDSISLSSFNNMIQPLFEKVLHLRKENEKLNELKQLYLKKFFG